jgi:hypothetical protein
LVGDYGHHEEEIEAKGPEDEEFGAVEVAAGDVVLFGSDELVGFEGGEDEGLVGGGDRGWRGLYFGHRLRVSRESNFHRWAKTPVELRSTGQPRAAVPT